LQIASRRPGREFTPASLQGGAQHGLHFAAISDENKSYSAARRTEIIVRLLTWSF
jgi:hypothetical protein